MGIGFRNKDCEVRVLTRLKDQDLNLKVINRVSLNLILELIVLLNLVIILCCYRCCLAGLLARMSYYG